MWRRASAASPERSELQAHDATVLQCLAFEVSEGLGRSPGPRHTSSASFLGTPQDSGRLPCFMPRRCFRTVVSSCQATSSTTSSVPLNEIASPARCRRVEKEANHRAHLQDLRLFARKGSTRRVDERLVQALRNTASAFAAAEVAQPYRFHPRPLEASSL